MRQFTQANRRLKLTCAAAGEDVLQLVSFKGVEEMSRPFQFALDLISTSSAIKPSDLVGQRVSFCVVMSDEGDTERWFDGFVSSFSYRGSDDRADLSRYHAQIVPWIWFMGRTSDCRIFQSQSIPEIVRQVLGECPNSSFDDAGVEAGKHPKLEYCVQYRETDLAFVSRLLERAGIYFYFTHVEGAHKLVLADSKSGYIDCAESEVTFHSTRGQEMDEDMLLEWERRAEFQSGAIASTDYNFKTPGLNLAANASTTMPFTGVHDYELFEYPGNYPVTAEGDQIVNVRMEEQETMHDVANGRSRCCTFHCGGRFTVAAHHNEAEDQKSWTLIKVRHEAELGGAYVAHSNLNGAGESEGANYVNDFTCIPAETTFRPPRITPRPVVGGLQTAVVVGAPGQEIQVDDSGRIRVQFFWDRYGHRKADASRWVRVAQTWAGQGYGAWFLPRVGHEVVVAFEDGDPDRPIITGGVYHAENKHPYAQPGNKTQSGIKTHSSQGGGSSNYNEIKFEDKKGSELLSIQAEKNRHVLVKNNNSESIGNDESLLVGHDRVKHVSHDETTTVDNNRTETVHKDEKITVDGNRTETVHKDETISIDKNRTETVGLNETLTIGVNRTRSVGANEAVTIGANKTETIGAMRTLTIGMADAETIGLAKALSIGTAYQVSVGAAMNETVGGLKATEVALDHSESAGKNRSMSVGKKLSISAGDEITLSTGDASINMKKDGTITISGKSVTVEGTKTVTVSGAQEAAVKSSTQVTVKGTLVKINC